MATPTKRLSRKIVGVLAQVVRVVSGRQMAGRNLTVFSDDVFLTSYPRSGNTWTRFLIGNLISPLEPVTFLNIEKRVPEIYFNSDHQMRALPRPRVLKSHECFQPHYPQIIYIVRDTRDVALSFYHHNLKARNIPDQYPMDEFIPRFLSAEFDRKWGTWADHVQSWLLMRQQHPGFILVRYEDMKRNAEHELLRIAAFLKQRSFENIDISSEKLRLAVDLSSPDRMRKLEQEQSGQWILTRSTRADKPFVRSGIAGKWKSVLSPASVMAIESAWGPIMHQLGYELFSTGAKAAELTSGAHQSTLSVPPGQATSQ